MSETNTEMNNNKNKRGLGRGLGSLLGASSDVGMASQISSNEMSPSKQEETKKQSIYIEQTQVTKTKVEELKDEKARIWTVGIDKLRSGEYQPRKEFEKEALQGLAQSIKSNGILQPIVARKNKAGDLEIVAGERRWRAAQIAGLHEVPVIVQKLENQQTLELAIIENVQREDLHPLEQAEAFVRLSQEFYLTQQQIAEKVGKDRASVANTMRLLSLQSEIKKMLRENKINMGHAKVLLSVTDEKKQLQLAQIVAEKGLSVRALEKTAQLFEHEKKNIDGEREVHQLAGRATMEHLIQAIAEELQKQMSTKVKIDYKKGKGTLKIAFYSDEELNHIVDKLKSGYEKR